MNKNELANKIRRIDGLTNGEKSALIELLRKQKKYGLVWEDKHKAFSQRERFDLMVQKNPNIMHLKDKFGLELA
jgi:adenine-specific DNA-methyltransferase